MSDTEPIPIDVTPLDDGIMLSPKGEIDLSRSPSLRQAITQAQQDQPARLVIDLTNVPYMDSSGVAILIEAMRAAQGAGGQMIVCGLQDKVRSIFEISRLDMIFTIVDSCEDAVAT